MFPTTPNKAISTCEESFKISPRGISVSSTNARNESFAWEKFVFYRQRVELSVETFLSKFQPGYVVKIVANLSLDGLIKTQGN